MRNLQRAIEPEVAWDSSPFRHCHLLTMWRLSRSTQFLVLRILKQWLTLGPISMDTVQITLSALTLGPVAVPFIRHPITCTNNGILVEPLHEPCYKGEHVLFSRVGLCPSYYRTDGELS